MLTIRFQRTGRKNQPSFKIVVTEKHKSSTKGRFVEEIGFYNPVTKEKILQGERAKYWISVGAQPSATVHNLLVADKIINSAKIAKNKKSKKPAEAPATAAAAPATPASVDTTAPASMPETAPAENPAQAAPEPSAPKEPEQPQQS